MVKPDYYILIGGSEKGPWTLRQVQAFWTAGAVTMETLYAKPGATEWKPLSTILDSATPVAMSNACPECSPPNTYSDEAGIAIQPSEKGLIKLRLWIIQKLASINLLPESKNTAAKERKFSDWLCGFSGSEQEAIFGASNIHDYRKGKKTWHGLIREVERLAAENMQGSPEQLTPGNSLWIMDAVCGAEPTLELDVEKFSRMGAESAKEANRIIIERRRLRALGDMTTEPFKKVPSA